MFFDTHIHALADVDDGAKTTEEMYEMIDSAYQDGARYICLTPHFHFGYFNDNTSKRDRLFHILQKNAKEKYPDLCIMLGNELRYIKGCVAYLESGQCKTMNDTNYVLVDFSETDSKKTISNGLDRILNAGYLPILAHAERYRSIWGDLKFISDYQSKGVKIQIDTQSVLGMFGLRAKFFATLMLKNRLADFIGSDAHNMKKRSPGIKKAYEYIEKKCGKDYAEAVCFRTALNCLIGHDEEGK